MWLAAVVPHRPIVTSFGFGASKLPENDIEADTEKDTFPLTAAQGREGAR
jgi:hypothetical protein